MMEAFGLAEPTHELFAFWGAEDELVVYLPRHAVIVGDQDRGGGLQTTLAHGCRIEPGEYGAPSPDLRIVVLSLVPS